MKKILLLLLCMPLMSFGLNNEPVEENMKDMPNPEVVEQRLEKMIIHRVKLSDKEAATFSALFKDFQQKQRKLGKEIFELKDDAYDSPKEYTDAINKICSLEIQMATNAQTYMQKLLKVFPAKKVFRIMKVQDDFRRRVVKGNNERDDTRGPRFEGAPD